MALMRCGKDHPRTYDVPAEAVLEMDRNGETVWVKIDGQPVKCTVEACKPRWMRIAPIFAKISNGPCGAKCTDAEGNKCVCSCGGRNHGKEA